MNPREKVDEIGGALQVLAFNMLDELDHLNLHSGRETARDLSLKVFDMADEMRHLIKSLIHNMKHLGLDGEVEEAIEMDSMLEVVRHCSIEPESYRRFIATLMPLIKLLNKWSESGPVRAEASGG